MITNILNIIQIYADFGIVIMKYCFVSTFFPGVTLSTIQNIVKKGHKADYYMFAQQGKVQTETLQFDKPVKGSRVIPINKSNSIYKYLNSDVNLWIIPFYIVKNRKYIIGLIPYFKNILIINKLLKQIISSNYDIIYIVVNEENDAILCEMLKRRGINNIIIAYHEVLENHIGIPKIKTTVKRTQNLGYPIVVHSENVKQILFRYTGNNNIHKIPFGPMETYMQYDIGEPMIAEPYILYIGSIQPYKGLSFMYEALENEGKDLNCKIVIAGNGYDPLINRMKLNQRYIIINRFLSDIEFSNLIKYANCIICPYVAGSQSGIPSVALLHGTPIVATKTAAFEEYIEDGVNGLLVDYNDKEQLISAINRIIKSSKINYSRIPEKLKWNNIIDIFEELCYKTKQSN